MKKFIYSLVSIFLVSLVIIGFFVFASDSGEADQYRLHLGSEEVVLDVSPIVLNDRAFVPLRTISEAIGATVEWDSYSSVAIVYRDSDRLVLTIDSNIALYNDIQIPMDVAPVLSNDRTLLPLRFISEWLGLQVNYESGTIRMFVLEPLEHLDTMDAPRGNSNGNLNNERHAIIWQNKLFHYCFITHSLVLKDLITNERRQLTPAFAGSQSRPRYFNIWQDQLYVNIQGNFVRIDEDGNILETIIEDVGYCQIHDGWLYFMRKSDGQLCRRLLAGGDVQPLGVFLRTNSWTGVLYEALVITDQHIFVNDGESILRMKLDGTDRRRLLTADLTEWDVEVETWDTITYYTLNGLEYANGLLYFNVGGRASWARLCQMNLDGTGLREVVSDGAAEIVVAGDWLYYTKLERTRISLDLGGRIYEGGSIARVRLDGNGREVLGTTNTLTIFYDSPTVMPDGSVYYRKGEMSNFDVWRKVTN